MILGNLTINFPLQKFLDFSVSLAACKNSFFRQH